MKRLLRPAFLLAFAAVAVTADVPAVSDAAIRVMPESNSATASAADPAAAVGALFSFTDNQLSDHFCTASVVDSPAGNLVLTAAHCIDDVDDEPGQFAFVPGYHDGVAPFGIWTVSKTYVDPRWTSDTDPDLDFGFLAVRQDGNPRRIEDITGANRLGVERGYTNQVTLTGFPDTAETPVTARATTGKQDTYQLRVDSPGFSDGTSGAPWVTGANPGTVIGVVGGYQFGGDEDDVSYSSYFDGDIANLYRTASSNG